jgi:hypothetical protein
MLIMYTYTRRVFEQVGGWGRPDPAPSDYPAISFSDTLAGMDVYLTKEVRTWATKAGVTDGMFHDAAEEIARGLVDANHGSGLFKKRVASNAGRGKSGGARTLLAFNSGNRVVYLYAFKKNEQATVKKDALKPYRTMARIYNHLTSEQIKVAVDAKELHKVKTPA